MTRNQAQKALLKGKKITHRFFFSDEFIQIKNGVLVDEKGYHMRQFWFDRQGESWDTGYEEYTK